MNEIHIADNLIVLDMLANNKREFDLIYIDPPYNTKSKFSYNDNKPSSEWIDMMASRLKLAYEVLSPNGSIFISIDDNELYNLKLLSDQIFGKANFLGNLITRQAQRSNAKHINTVHEYILAYAKDKRQLPGFSIPRVYDPFSKTIINKMYKSINPKLSIKENEKNLSKVIKTIINDHGITWIRNYNSVDQNGKIFFAKDLSTPGSPRKVNLPEIGLFLNPLKTRGWSSDKKFVDLHKKNRISYKGGRPYEIHYLEESVDNVSSILDFYSRQGTEDLKKLGLTDFFETPKPVELIKYLIRIAIRDHKGSILDFFAGSGTTAQAVLEINLEDNKNLEFCLVQIDDKIDPSSKIFLKLNELSIEPSIASLMQFRIDRFLKQKNLDIKYCKYKY
jgi:adenine-specific DNA-methyltransferase